jgi:hypothetical protein
MSASAVVAIRVSYVHAGIQVLHFPQLIEIHRIIGTREDLVHFVLKALIGGRIEEKMVKSGCQRRLDGIRTSDNSEGAIGEDVRDRGTLSFQTAAINLEMFELSMIKR